MSANTTRRAIAVFALREPRVLKVIGEESLRNGTSELTSRQIDRIIKAARSQGTKR
ncbi:MAG TPA: hypothetical protein VN310_00595 [Candidatus Dormibacteraeota bacterium]|nr:hypothetical protein [Candidatus Dormibacteraeota bacterium]